MADEDATILHTVDHLVKDEKKIVSYKWLSRDCSISSAHSKKVLMEYANNNKESVKSIWTVSGWIEANPSVFSIRLIDSIQLEEERDSIIKNGQNYEIYSVQLSLPLDFCDLCNEEILQSESLFSEPYENINCLRDNRYSSVKCSDVQYCLSTKRQPNQASNDINMFKAVGIGEPNKTQNKKEPKVQLKSKSASEVQNNNEVEGQDKLNNLWSENASTLKKMENVNNNSKAESGIANLWAKAKKKTEYSHPQIIVNEKEKIIDAEINRDANGEKMKVGEIEEKMHEINSKSSKKKHFPNDDGNDALDSDNDLEGEDSEPIKFSVMGNKLRSKRRKRSDDSDEDEGLKNEYLERGYHQSKHMKTMTDEGSKDEEIEEAIICSQYANEAKHKNETSDDDKDDNIIEKIFPVMEYNNSNVNEKNYNGRVEKQRGTKSDQTEKGTDLLSESGKALFQDELRMAASRNNNQSRVTTQKFGKRREVRSAVDAKGRESFEVVWIDDINDNSKIKIDQSISLPKKAEVSISKPSVQTVKLDTKSSGGKGKADEKEKGKKQGNLLSFFAKK